MKRLAARASILAGFVAVGAWCAPRIDFGTDITNFMPDGRSTELASLARHLARSDLARTMMLTVGSAAGGPPTEENEARIARVVTAMKQELAASPDFEWVRSGIDEGDFEEIWKAYYPHRFGLVSLDPEREIPARTTPDAIAAAAVHAKESLTSPAAAMTKLTLPGDPLGFSQQILSRMTGDSPSLELRRGIFFAPDGFGVLLAATRASAFDAQRQAPVLEKIDALFARLNAAGDGGLVLEKSGANRFAVDAERSMKRDMVWVGAASLASVALLVLVYLRSLTRFFITLLPAVGGILAATALGLLVYGHLDGLTIAFGASLLGAAIDYPIYLLNHIELLGGRSWDVARRHAPTLASGALTSVAGFAGLSLTSYPGFREIGFFAATGIGAGLAITFFVVPVFVDDDGDPPREPGRTARFLGRAAASMLSRPRALMAALVAVVVLGAVALPRLQWHDDLSKLGNIDPALEAEERKVQQRVASFESGRVAVVTGDSEQQALERSEEIARRMAPLRSSGAIGEFRSPTSFVWSQSLQQRNLAALRGEKDLSARVEQAFGSAGFRAEVFQPFARDLEAGSVPLVPADFRGSAVERMLQPLLLSFDGRTAAITQISKPKDEDAVRAAVLGVPSAQYFVQRDFVNEMYARFRDTNFEQMLLGWLMVVVVLMLRYRHWRPAFAAFLPSALVPVIVLSGFALAGVQVNLLHVMSLMLVTGMGVDYGIFVVDSRSDARELETTWVSLLLCCLTTVAGFGVLAISSHPALRAMGVTIGAGVLLSLLLAPVSLLVMGRAPQSGGDPH